MISLFDLKTQRAVLKSRIDENISKVLDHGKFILGPEVSELEQRLCEYTGANFCISCANGTDALQIALMAVGVGPGDEVITSAFSYIAAAEAISLLGAKPIFVDIDPISYNINPMLIEENITPNTKAIIPVSLYGQPADFRAINELASKHNLIVIEDGAQSFGSLQDGKKSCNLSDIGCTSFFPTKSLGCYGDGGAIFTSDENLAVEIRKIARHGQEKKYHHSIVGVNSRLDTIQAAVLLAKLEILDEEIAARQAFAQYFQNNVSGTNLTLPTIAENNSSCWGIFTARHKLRDDACSLFKHYGIATGVYYPMPLNEQNSLLSLEHQYLEAREASRSVFSIPCHAYLSKSDAELICKALSDTVIMFDG